MALTSIGAVISTTRLALCLALCLPFAALGGCAQADKDTKEGLPAAPDQMTLTSPAFPDGGQIPAKYTCDGDNVPPPLRWSGVPAGADSLALVVEDPNTPGGTFVHWTLFDIDTGLTGVAEGKTPANAIEGENSFGNTGYGGPCPPKGADAHHYFFGLYSLPESPDLKSGAKPSEVFDAIERDAGARGVLEGTYRR
jgi:Raf kinase inhibitor-like YbhB/YbcL family protein